MSGNSHYQWQPYFDQRRLLEIQDDRFCVYTAGPPDADVVFVLLHGGGQTALSWALATNVIKSEFGVLAFDYRGHGATQCQDESDLSTETLTKDAVAVIKNCVKEDSCIIFAGHSLGGALAIHIAASRLVSVSGICVIDVVEGTAIPALAFMPALLKRRPTAFASIEDAVCYVINSNTLHSRTAAEISVPPQLCFNNGTGNWVWRTDLAKSEPYWISWYEGITSKFLSLSAAKMLVLAHTDRMDKDILISQMQGKIQVEIISGGHSIQEDSYDTLSQEMIRFAKRNKFAELRDLNRRAKSASKVQK